MEKRRPHYDLKSIQEQMFSLDGLILTMSAKHGIKRLGMSLNDAMAVIQMLSLKNFYKAMTVHVSNKVWQDVYHAEWKGKPLYIKFQQVEQFFIVSFKER